MARGNDRKQEAAANRAAAVAAEETPENLDKVRDILFGGQMRSVESRFARLEERLQRDQDALREHTTAQLARLESYTKKELTALNERLKAERAKRTEELKAVSAQLRDNVTDLDKRLASLDDATSKADADLRDLVLAQSKEIMLQLQQLSEHFADQLKQETDELRAEKTDTASLIEVFSEMALRLSDDFQPAPERQ